MVPGRWREGEVRGGEGGLWSAEGLFIERRSEEMPSFAIMIIPDNLKGTDVDGTVPIAMA